MEQHFARLCGFGRDLQYLATQAHTVHRQVDIVTAAGCVDFAGDLFAARLREQVLHVKEQVFTLTVISRGQDSRALEHGNSIHAYACVSFRNDALAREHQGVRGVDLQQCVEEILLAVLEIR